MQINRRKLLGDATAATSIAVVRKATGVFGIGSVFAKPYASTPCKWHPLTQSLLERARRIGRGNSPPDRALVERTIRRFSDLSGNTNAPVIKWMDTPTGVHDHFSQCGLDALLNLGTATFWRRSQPPDSDDEETFERAFEVRMMVNELLGIDACDRILMAPKLLAKSQAISASRSSKQVFRIRAVSSQIGWLETTMADAAAQAISNIELLLGIGISESSVAIDNQLRIFECYEYGLLATWETPDALICVVRQEASICKSA